jgi:hypothetical protein
VQTSVLPLPAKSRVVAESWAGDECGCDKRCRPNGSDAKLQAAFTCERTSGAPLAAKKERFCLSDLQAA